jgi:hypothetical protein
MRKAAVPVMLELFASLVLMCGCATVERHQEPDLPEDEVAMFWWNGGMSAEGPGLDVKAYWLDGRRVARPGFGMGPKMFSLLPGKRKLTLAVGSVRLEGKGVWTTTFEAKPGRTYRERWDYAGTKSTGAYYARDYFRGGWIEETTAKGRGLKRDSAWRKVAVLTRVYDRER